jgi:hypothetical protein
LVITGSPLRCERIDDFYFDSKLPGSSLQNLEKNLKRELSLKLASKLNPTLRTTL